MDIKESDSIKVVAARWLASQGVPTVLLFAILFLMAYAMYHGANTVIPDHLKAINNGYKSIEDSHVRENALDRDSHKEEVLKLTEAFERTLTRISEMHRPIKDDQ